MYNPNRITVFAQTNFRNQKRKFGIKAIDRSRHMYLIGKTGMGKSTTLEHLIMADIREGNGVAVIDPHGDLVEKIVNYIPASRINDVVYFNPADVEYPIAFNVLENVDPIHQHLVASGLVGVFKKMFAESWGPRLEYLLRNAVLALLDYPGSTLLGVQRILTDKLFRRKVIKKIKDPIVKSFWVDEYSKYPDRFQAEAIAPIQNKVGQFLSISLIRNIIAQVKSSIDVRDIMDNKKILLLNLAKGRIGEDASSLFGAMMITKIQLAAMERIEIPESERVPFYLYVDEFQNFATESFATILSEARKYALNLIVAHQYIEQLEEKVEAAVFGNVGTILCFRVGATDAEELVKEFTPYFTEEDLVNLTKYDIYMRLMIDGVASKPFSATTLPPLSKEEMTNNLEKILKVSRERYSVAKNIIEDKIIRWIGAEMDEQIKRDRFKTEKPKRATQEEPAVAPRSLVQKPQVEKPVVKEEIKEPKIEVIKSEQPKEVLSASVPLRGTSADKSDDYEKLNPKIYPYEVRCDSCGKLTRVSFAPDGIKPVYCKACLSKIREERARKKSPITTIRPTAKESDNPQKMQAGQSIKL